MKVLIKEALGYGIASAVALLVDMSILWVLVQFCSWGYLPAAALAYGSGATVAYLLSVRLAFKQHRLHDRRAEFASFIAIGTLGLAVNSLVIAAAIRYLALHYLIAKCVAAGCTFTCNFVARRQLLFVSRTLA